MIIRLIAGLIKKISFHKTSYYPKPDTYVRNKIKVELDLSNYAIKSDVKNAAGVDTSDFAKKADLASLNSEADNIGEKS